MVVWQRWLLFGIAPLTVGALVAWWGAARPVVPAPSDPVSSVAKDKQLPDAALRLIGTASCSARGCHGALHPALSSLDSSKCRQDEYIRWANDDPHANAFRVLFNERSQRIMKLLDSGTTNKNLAHEDARCLACHTNPALAGIPQDDRLVQTERQFGVGCESCHGSASKWLVPHTSPAWRKLNAAEKWVRYQMVPVAHPTHLSRTCVGCHVGAPPHSASGLPLRDVNHDLIAAGHPRLNFEFASYLTNVPEHWRPQKRSEAANWAVGQHVSAQAALDLLMERAKSGPWPEFAEYNCYSCHHSLAQPSWRQKAEGADKTKRRPGSLAWGSWYFLLVRDAQLQGLAHTMEQPAPDRQLAEEQAHQARNRLYGTQRQVVREKPDLYFEWLRKASLTVERNWDSAEQIYLGLSALNQDRPREALTKLLQELTPLRQFAAGYDSPNSWKTQGQPAFHPNDFFDRLQPLRNPQK